MRRWSMSSAPRDGTIIIGCTRVEGVEREIYWSGGSVGCWYDKQTGIPLPDDLIIAWKRRHAV